MADNETPKLSVFDRLKKLFNGSIIYRPLGSNKIKVVDPSRLQSSGARSNTRLMDKFGRLYSNNSSAFGGVGVTEESAQITKMQLYADYENMDTDAIISSALDIIADECLSGETVIPLLDGRKLTIKEIHDLGLTNFWVYSVDEEGDFKPALCERVAYNGTQSVDEITLEDGSIIKSTSKHKWVMNNGDIKFTEDLSVFDGISALRTKLSSRKNHRIIDIKRNVGKEDVYDLVNVGDNHIYAIECNDGSKLFTHNCTTKNERGDILQIRSEHEDVKEHLENLFYDILDIDFNLWPWIRSMCKYGDMYLGLDVREKYGIVGAIPLSNYFMQRIEGSDEDPYETTFKLVDFTSMGNGGYGNSNRYGKDTDITEFEQYEIAHFRLLNDVNFLPYGKSYLEGARKLFKQLCLDENTNIWTPTGYVKIKDIKIGDEIYSFDYETGEKVVNKVKNHILTGNKETYEVKTSHRTIRGTKEHPLMIEGGIYKNIGDLTTNDKLILPTNITEREYSIPNIELDVTLLSAKFDEEYFKTEVLTESEECRECGDKFKIINHLHLNNKHKLTLSEYKAKHDIGKQYHKLINRNERIKLEEAKLYCDYHTLDETKLNLYFDQSPTPIIDLDILDNNRVDLYRFFAFLLGDGWIDEHRLCFSLGDNLSKSQRYVELLNELNVNYTIMYEGQSKAYVIISNPHLLYIIKNKLEFVTGTRNKFIPNWVFNLPKEEVKQFLLGFVDADGCYLKNDRMRVCGVNKELIEGLQQLAQINGFQVSNLQLKRGGEISETFGHILSDEYTVEFSFKEVENETKYIYEKITKIIKHEECTNVYDIEVESDLHNFIADGLIAHNCLMEDAMLLHRIMRAPEKRLFKIDVGGLSQDEIAPYMENIINKIKKTPFQDPETGEYNLNFNLENMTEDFFMPVRGSEVNNGIESINGLQYDMIDDIDYLKGKLFAALKAPKAFLGYEDGIDGTSVLSQQDVRFARTIERIQKMAINELTKMAIIHLYTKGIASEKLVEFDLQLTIPSIIAEQEKISLFNEKVSLASQMKDLKMISRDFIYTNVFNFSKQEAQEEAAKSIEDIKTLFRETQIENEGNDPKVTGESYGTAHDIASMHTTKKFEPQDMGGSEPGGQPGAGRPNTHTKYGAWDHPDGPDPLGKKNIKKVYDYEDDINATFKANGIKQAVAANEGKETDTELVKEEKIRLNTNMTRKRKAIIEALKNSEFDTQNNKDRFIQARNSQLKSNALIATYKLESSQPNQPSHKFLEDVKWEREQDEMEDFLSTTFLNTDKLEDK